MDLLELNEEEEDFEPQGEKEINLEDLVEKCYTLYPPNDSDFNLNDNNEEISEISESVYYISSNNNCSKAK